MTPERYQQAKIIFSSARELPAAQRDDFIKRACVGDDEMLQEVRSLLEHDDLPTQTSLRQVEESLPVDASAPEEMLVHRSIGGYRIERIIASGGMGTVYEAWQESPRRKVALKAMRRGLRSPSALRRFEYEAELLGRLKHPGIAQVYGAGTFTEGNDEVPYFVMEHIANALRITDYADQHKLSMEDRLELFASICDAVHHAHQKGIIHRDLKPGNILVDPSGQIKVIDFGVARFTGTDLDITALHTGAGEVLGTLRYMSPEQAVAGPDDIDTRSDIYSLGVVLYELLTGHMPFEPSESDRVPLLELQRMIAETDPPRPSVRVSTTPGTGPTVTAAREEPPGESSAESPAENETPSTAGHKAPSALQAGHAGVDSRTLAQRLRGDLDWIVMKCLEKDPARRYETAEAVASDVRRHLQHQPVLAGPPGATYRMRKFVRRNRAGVAAATLIALAMIGATVVSTAFAVREAEHRRIAEEGMRLAEERLERALAAEEEMRRQAEYMVVITQFQADRLGDVDARAMGEDLRAAIVERRRRSIAPLNGNEAEVEIALAALDDALEGVNFTSLALQTINTHVLEADADAIRERFVDEPTTMARLLHQVAVTQRRLGLYDDAEVNLSEALEIRRRVLGDHSYDALESTNSMAVLHSDQNRRSEAVVYNRKAWEGYRQLLGEEHRRTLRSMHNLGSALIALRRFDEAEPLVRGSLEIHRRVMGDDDVATLNSLNTLANLLMAWGKLEDAETYRLETLEQANRIRGNDHPFTVLQLAQMGRLRQKQGRPTEALTYLNEALAGNARVLGDDHPSTLELLHEIGVLHRTLGDNEEAARYLQRAVEGRRRTRGDTHFDTLHSMNSLAVALGRTERAEEAEEVYYASLDGYRRLYPGDHMGTATRLANVASFLARQERFADAEPHFREATDMLRRIGRDSRYTYRIICEMGSAMMALGDLEEAESCYIEALEGLQRLSDANDVSVVLSKLANLREEQGRLKEAAAHYLEVIDLRQNAFDPDDPATVTAITNLVDVYDALHAAEPEAGHAAAAAEWTRMLSQASDEPDETEVQDTHR